MLFKGKNLIPVLLILLGTITQSLVMVKSGQVYDYGMGFWGPNAHDGLWHVSLINQLAKFDFSHPSFAGFPIVNYHYGYDLLVTIIHRLTLIPVVNLYFRILPPIFSLLIGILVFKLVKKLTISTAAASWALFFTYFGGSFGYMVNLIKGQGWGGESAFWAIQSISFPVNPPFMLSLIIIFGALISLTKFLRLSSPIHFLISALLFGTLIMIKVYAGLIVLGSLFIVGIYNFVSNRNPNLVKLFLASCAISFLIFFPSNRNSTSLVKWEPLWFPRTMVQFTDRVGWPRFADARQTYSQSKNYLKWVPAEMMALLLFIAGNLGTRIIGFPTLAKTIKSASSGPSPETLIKITLAAGVVISILPTLFFIQRGNPWNTIQFFYYTEIFMGIFAAMTLSQPKKLNIGHWTLNISIVALTLPSTYGTLPNYLPSRPPSAVPPYELKALNFLRSQPPGTVLTYPYDKALFNKFLEPRPLFAYESIAYVSAISNHQTFLEDEVNLEISQYPWRPRREEVVKLFTTPDNDWARQFLSQNNIEYIYYLVDLKELSFGPAQGGLTEIYYEPHGVRILKRESSRI